MFVAGMLLDRMYLATARIKKGFDDQRFPFHSTAHCRTGHEGQRMGHPKLDCTLLGKTETSREGALHISLHISRVLGWDLTVEGTKPKSQ